MLEAHNTAAVNFVVNLSAEINQAVFETSKRLHLHYSK